MTRHFMNLLPAILVVRVNSAHNLRSISLKSGLSFSIPRIEVSEVIDITDHFSTYRKRRRTGQVK